MQQPHLMQDFAVLDARSVSAMLRGRGDGLARHWEKFLHTAAANGSIEIDELTSRFRSAMERKECRHHKMRRWIRRLGWIAVGAIPTLLWHLVPH
jgi:hypothetical protein